jgi:hypothetical protein
LYIVHFFINLIDKLMYPSLKVKQKLRLFLRHFSFFIFRSFKVLISLFDIL